MRSPPRPRPVPCLRATSFDCSSFHANKPNTKSTAHFYLQYTNSSLQGLTVEPVRCGARNHVEHGDRRLRMGPPPEGPGVEPAGRTLPGAHREPGLGPVRLRHGHPLRRAQEQPRHPVERPGRDRLVHGAEPELRPLPGHPHGRDAGHRGARVQPLDPVRLRSAHRLRQRRLGLRRRRRHLDGGRGLRHLQRQLQLPVAQLHHADGQVRQVPLPLLDRVPRHDRTVRHRQRERRGARSSRRSGRSSPRATRRTCRR